MARRITLVINSLHGGGAERVASLMANHWADQGYQVTLVTLDAVSRDDFPLSDRVDRVGLDVISDSSNPLTAVWGNLRRLLLVRRAIKGSRPQHVISLVEKMNIQTLLSCTGLGLDVVICERVDPRQHAIGLVWSVLRRLTYPFCRALTVQTHRVAEYARRYVGRKTIYVIPNPVMVPAPPEGTSPAHERKEPHSIVSMGRLVPQKGFDLLIEAFDRVAAKHPAWQLMILGSGPQREALHGAIHEKGLQERVTLCGWVSDPHSVLANSDLFVLSSRYEGFPMALLEAMAYGLPVISFDCPSGPAEMICQDAEGRLVSAGDVAGLAESMDHLMSDASLRHKLAQGARQAAERFGQEVFFERWEAILDGATDEEYQRIAGAG